MTLVELLVVIAIITIIVSAIVVASFAAMKSGQIKATRGFMEKISLALAQYKLDYGMYVPSGVNGIADNLQEDSTYPLWQGLEHEGPAEISAENKVIGEPDLINDPLIVRYKYVDAWKKPLWYQCDGPDYTKFKLTSGGPDLIIGISTDASWGDNIVKE